jgi:hypothetical protein
MFDLPAALRRLVAEDLVVGFGRALVEVEAQGDVP